MFLSALFLIFFIPIQKEIPFEGLYQSDAQEFKLWKKITFYPGECKYSTLK